MIFKFDRNRAVSRSQNDESAVLLTRRSQGVITLHRPDTPAGAQRPAEFARQFSAMTPLELTAMFNLLKTEELAHLVTYATFVMGDRERHFYLARVAA